jgi:hypothetical protein
LFARTAGRAHPPTPIHIAFWCIARRGRSFSSSIRLLSWMTNSGDVTYCDRQGGIALAPIFSGWRLHGGGGGDASQAATATRRHHPLCRSVVQNTIIAAPRQRRAAGGSNPHSPAACLPYMHIICAERGRLSARSANAAPKRRGHRRRVSSRGAYCTSNACRSRNFDKNAPRSALLIKLC